MIILELWGVFLLGFFAGCFWGGRTRVVNVQTVRLPRSLDEYRRRRKDLVS